ncbi:MAG: hypothetical protein IKQ55_02655, partial [Kiritimatiellae bacterium]|nr:hypothetical protein [Kiritimatiellia bacterium]
SSVVMFIFQLPATIFLRMVVPLVVPWVGKFFGGLYADWREFQEDSAGPGKGTGEGNAGRGRGDGPAERAGAGPIGGAEGRGKGGRLVLDVARILKMLNESAVCCVTCFSDGRKTKIFLESA